MCTKSVFSADNAYLHLTLFHPGVLKLLPASVFQQLKKKERALMSGIRTWALLGLKCEDKTVLLHVFWLVRLVAF